ncbi:hypothetical protein [Endozoicomonas sp. ALB032]|uniref:hypothetical protein n=1 Tax=Endozoicomonas sp. ALB032 TaxID=3403082 RepID=UPI003BB5A856
MNVNNGNISGATGYSPAPQAPENTPEGTCFGKSVIVMDAESFHRSASIYDAEGEKKAIFSMRDQITSAKLSTDDSRAVVNTRDGVASTYVKSADSSWFLQDHITPDNLSADGNRAVINNRDGVAKIYVKDAEGVWFLQDSIAPADLRDDGTRAEITTDGVAKTYVKNADGLWFLQDTSMER